ncbi:MAG: TetR/AcrR family transcriptional regulator [Gaiellaceae bacterium]
MPLAPTRPALRARFDRRQQDVIDRAARVFAERGYHGTSMGDLIEATGLTSGGLYHYIGSKDELLFMILEGLMEPFLVRTRAIVREPLPAAERLRRVVSAWMEHVESHLDHMKVFQQERVVAESGPYWKQVRSRRKSFERILDRLLADLEREGSLRPADRRLALFALLGMVNWTTQWYDPSGRLSSDQIAQGFCDLLLGASPNAAARGSRGSASAP